MTLRRYIYVVLIWGLILGGACAPRTEIQPSPPLNLLTQGDRAWTHKNWSGALDFYKQAYSLGKIPHKKLPLYLQRMIICSLKLGKTKQAHSLFNLWERLSPSAPLSWEYTRLFLSYLLVTKGESETVKWANQFCTRGEIPLQTREKACFWILSRALSRGNITEGLSPFSKLYLTCPPSEQKRVEMDLFEFLKGHIKGPPPTQEWKRLSEEKFPENLIKWYYIVSEVKEDKMAWPLAYEKLCKIIHSDIHIKEILRQRLGLLTREMGIPVIRLLMVLPFKGAYSNISWKIVEGVEAALFEWQKTGIKAEVKIINSLSSDWLSNLRKSLGDCFIIGGPMRKEVWEEIQSQGLNGDKAFFLFRSDIPGGIEGRDAFRFFPSHLDQISTLVDFLMKEFQIKEYGILYPKGYYGRLLAEDFWRYVTQKGGEIKGLDWYDPSNPSSWQEKVRRFLGVPPGIFDSKDKEKIQEFTPSPGFRAVFIPDTFEDVQILVPNFFYFNSYNLFFLGPTLWATGHFDLTRMDKRLFKLALFPSPWKYDPQNPYLITLKKEVYFLSRDQISLWHSLGYDFFRFSMELLYRRIKDKEGLREILPSLNIPWTLAPITWDSKGVARERMYLLQPLKKGGVSVSIERLKGYYEYINQTTSEVRGGGRGIAHEGDKSGK